jgi:hypothetical protein
MKMLGLSMYESVLQLNMLSPSQPKLAACSSKNAKICFHVV